MLGRYSSVLRAQPRPLRFLASRLLMRSGLSQRLTLQRNGYRLRFFPTALTAALWVNPAERMGEERFLAGCLSQGDTVIDVGANIGTISLACARAVAPAGKVLAVEPHPRIFGYLEANIRFNDMADRVQARNVAVGARRGEAVISDGSDDTQNALAPSGSGEGLRVAVERLDDIAPAGPVALLKLDAEGYEPQILKGATKVCARTSMIYCEFNPRMLLSAGGALLELLRQRGFTLFTHKGERLEQLVTIPDGKCMITALRDPGVGLGRAEAAAAAAFARGGK